MSHPYHYPDKPLRGSGRGGTWFISRGITSSPILNGLPGGPMSSILIPPITMLNNHMNRNNNNNNNNNNSSSLNPSSVTHTHTHTHTHSHTFSHLPTSEEENPSSSPSPPPANADPPPSDPLPSLVPRPEDEGRPGIENFGTKGLAPAESSNELSTNSPPWPSSPSPSNRDIEVLSWW